MPELYEGKLELNRIETALQSPDFAQVYISRVGVDLVSTLLAKNLDYGSSAWDSPLLCSHLSPGDALLCRMSDKIARLQNLLSGKQPQVQESIEDTIKDLAGYCLLLLASPEPEWKKIGA